MRAATEGDSERISYEDVARTARAMIEAYGRDAACLMRRRLVAIRRRGDQETAQLWGAVAEAVDIRLHARERV
jgi:hypothetical protein